MTRSSKPVWRFLFILVMVLPKTDLASDAGRGQPNIILIVADDMRWDAMSCAGNTVVNTPNLDRLAASGMRFTNAFVTTSICCVSRASIFTGQYARRHGVNDFHTPLPDLNATYPILLRNAGYYTGFIGKWGIDHRNRSYFQECALTFDFWAGDIGHTSYWHEADCNYIKNNGTTERSKVACSCPAEARKAQGVGSHGPHPALRNPVHAETGFIPAKIRSFLDQRDSRKPFCLSVSLKAPHDPWAGFATQFSQDFKGVDVPRRPNVSRADAAQQASFLRKSLGADRGFEWASDEINLRRSEALHDQCRLVKDVDYAVGEVLRELEQRSLASSTVVIFTSDHGYLNGEHGFSGKWLMYEESLRIPLIIFDPRMPSGTPAAICEEMVLTIDLARSILALAGKPAPSSVQGMNLLPLLKKPALRLREDFFYEHLYRHQSRIAASEGVRTREWKYIVYVDQSGPDREELFNLNDDPFEMRNLAQVPTHADQLRKMRRRHLQFAENLK